MKLSSKKILAIIALLTMGHTVQAQFVPAPTTGIRMSVTTTKAVGEKIELLVHSIEKKGIWIDLNGDATYQQGEEITVFDEAYHEYTIGTQTLTIYGNTTRLGCRSTGATAVDVTKNPNLTYLACPKNNLKSLDLTQNPKLLRVWCDSNEIESLDLSGNPALIILGCDRNKLTELKTDNNPKLASLWCSDNNLTELELSANPRLNDLWCFGNRITKLDLSANPLLVTLWCSDNELSTLDLSKNPDVAYLWCSSNKLTSLNLSGVKGLSVLVCHSNQIAGEEMTKVVNALPTLSSGAGAQSKFVVVDLKDTDEKNICTVKDVEKAKSKNWRVFDFNGDSDNMLPYEGSPTSNLAVDAPTVRIYPNPVGRYALVEIPESLLGQEAALYDMNGVKVYSFAVESLRQNIDLTHLPDGTYFFRLDNYTTKLIKQ